MRIGITGTIGSGKTEVVNYIKSKGYDVFNCDEVNTELLEEKSYDLLFSEFNDCFDNKVLNKTKLADTIFSDHSKKRKLESIMHPLILNKLLAIKSDLIFAEVPLLFECGWEKYFDHTILLVSDEKIALERLMARGINNDDSKRRILSQMPVEEKIKKASFIIYNNGSLDDLYSSIDKILKQIC